MYISSFYGDTQLVLEVHIIIIIIHPTEKGVQTKE